METLNIYFKIYILTRKFIILLEKKKLTLLNNQNIRKVRYYTSYVPASFEFIARKYNIILTHKLCAYIKL